MIWSLFADVLPSPPTPSASDNTLYWYIGGGVGALVVILVLFRLLFGGKKAVPDLEAGLRENLSEYPPAPKLVGKKRLTVNGVPVRLRLVVVAPMGKQSTVTTESVGEILDEVLYGLSRFLETDKPRMKVWPPQLSAAGFAPTFHRVIEYPDAPGAKSNWSLVAGITKASGRPVLLGLACYADTPVKLVQLHLDAKDWRHTLQIESNPDE